MRPNDNNNGVKWELAAAVVEVVDQEEEVHVVVVVWDVDEDVEEGDDELLSKKYIYSQAKAIKKNSVALCLLLAGEQVSFIWY
jgi:hypothetical protein